MFPRGGGKQYSIFCIPFIHSTTKGKHKSQTKQLCISRDFLNSPVVEREVGVHTADQRSPETAAMLWVRWLFSSKFWLRCTGLQMKQREEGRSFCRLKAPVSLLGMSAIVARLREIKEAVDKQRAADNSTENTATLYPAVCEFIRPHAEPLVISKYMQLIWCRCVNSVEEMDGCADRLFALGPLWFWWVGSVGRILHYIPHELYWVPNYDAPLVLSSSLLLNWPCIFCSLECCCVFQPAVLSGRLALLLQKPA